MTIDGCIERQKLNNISAKIIYVRNQVIPELGLDSVRNLGALVTISFWGCNINTVVPGAFRKVPVLKNVQLSYGNLKEIPRNLFEAMPNIEVIRIHNIEIVI